MIRIIEKEVQQKGDDMGKDENGAQMAWTHNNCRGIRDNQDADMIVAFH